MTGQIVFPAQVDFGNNTFGWVRLSESGLVVTS
jgi:hypothetical protein